MQFSIVVESSIGGSFLWSQKTHGTIFGIAFPSKVENWSPATKQNKTKIIEFDQKLAELWVVLGPNVTLKNVFCGHLGSRDLECRSKVTNILMFFESSMPLPCLCKVWSKFIEYFLIYIQLIVVVHILVKYLQTGHRVWADRKGLIFRLRTHHFETLLSLLNYKLVFTKEIK